MLKKSRKPRPKSPSDPWFLYLLRCTDGTLYTGIAKDVSRRCQQHNAGSASRYTSSRLPVVVVYQEAHASHSLALRREAAIKALSRQQKLSLIRLEGRRCRKTKGRRGKGVTTISDLPLDQAGLQELASKLKQRCDTDGTVKDSRIEIHSDQRERLASVLKGMGYRVKRIGG